MSMTQGQLQSQPSILIKSRTFNKPKLIKSKQPNEDQPKQKIKKEYLEKNKIEVWIFLPVKQIALNWRADDLETEAIAGHKSLQWKFLNFSVCNVSPPTTNSLHLQNFCTLAYTRSRPRARGTFSLCPTLHLSVNVFLPRSVMFLSKYETRKPRPFSHKGCLSAGNEGKWQIGQQTLCPAALPAAGQSNIVLLIIFLHPARLLSSKLPIFVIGQQARR